MIAAVRPIAFQALVYPVTDADLDNALLHGRGEPADAVPRAAWCGSGTTTCRTWSAASEPDASPLQAKDFAGLPPAIVLTAEYDVLRDEGEAYADRLQEAGVPTDRFRVPGQMHGFFTLLMVPGHEEAIDQIATSLDAHLPAPTAN